MSKNIFLFLLFSIILCSCGTEYKQKGNENYIKEINDWHQNRISRLKLENGWLNLVGLFWLKEGENTFGSAKDNNIVFPDGAPEYIGTITLHDSTTVMKVNNDVNVSVAGESFSEIELANDMTGNPTLAESGYFKWFIIKRGEKYGIRLRNLNAPLLKDFKGIERFPVNSDWKITADFIPFDPPKIIDIPTVLGTIEKESSPGKVTFTIEGMNFSLTPVSSGSGLFFVFADKTNGEETYGAGRFLYTAGPDSAGKVIIDFNKAYNPPCAFTKYATCPLPSKENQLKIRITAGEMKYGEGH